MNTLVIILISFVSTVVINIGIGYLFFNMGFQRGLIAGKIATSRGAKK